jgi:hypothetical protein
MTVLNFGLWVVTYLLEITLISAFAYIIYNYLWQRLITRYTLAYPSLILYFNSMGWMLSIIIFWVYSIGDIFYDSFFGDGPTRDTQKYFDMFSYIAFGFTVVITSLCIYSIYKQERIYWKNKKHVQYSKN